MMFDSVNVRGKIWNYFFAQSDGVLTIRGRRGLIEQAVEFYMDGEQNRNIVGEGYVGSLERSGERLNLGTLVGEEIKGEIETTKGKRRVIFGITEYKADPEMN